MHEARKPLPLMEHETRPSPCGLFIAEHLKQGRQLLLDVDGVILRSDSLNQPMIIDEELIPTLVELEARGVSVGLATSRGMHAVEYLRSQGLRLGGVSILEDGQAVLKDGKLEYSVKPEFLIFINDLRQEVPSNPFYKTSWEKVKETAENGNLAFCAGNEQWQGAARASFWFLWKSKEHALQILEGFKPDLFLLMERHALKDTDIAVSLTETIIDNLGILSIKAKSNGIAVEKATAAAELDKPCIFVADGFGDSRLADVIKAKNGGVIGIEGNLDISNEVPEFLQKCAHILPNPSLLASALQNASRLLQTR